MYYRSEEWIVSLSGQPFCLNVHEGSDGPPTFATHIASGAVAVDELLRTQQQVVGIARAEQEARNGQVSDDVADIPI